MIVKGEGNPESKIWLIGEAPGANEVKAGQPFIGGSGMILNGILQSVGLDRKKCYIDNILQTQPKGNSFKDYYHDKSFKNPKQELLDAHARITALIDTYKPNVVVALGNEALFAVTGKKGILNWRGSILTCNGVKVVPTLHPAMIMRQFTMRPISVMDFNRIKEEGNYPEIKKRYNDNFKINPTFNEAIYYLKEVLPKKKIISFDIETLPPIEQIQCIGFGWSKEDAVCIPIFYQNNSWWTLEQELEIINAVKDLFKTPGVKWIAQNGQYDITYLADKWGVDVRNLWLDTMISFHTLYSELKKSLAFICSVYTHRNYYKSMGGDPDSFWTYNCLDTVVTWEAAQEIVKELKESNTWEFYKKYPGSCTIPVITIQREGCLIDVELREKIGKNLEKDIIEIQERLNKAVGYEINFNSPPQLCKFLYEDLKLPPVYRKRAGGKKTITADEEALLELDEKYPNPALTLVIEARKLQKLLSTYIQVDLEPGNIIKCTFLLTGTKTGRLSSKENVYGRGSNLQNIPRGPLIRSFFIPDPGNYFVEVDYSQAESWITAYEAGDPYMKKVLQDPERDVHKETALLVYKIHPNQVTKEQRQICKQVGHAANYVISAFKLSRMLGISRNQAQQLLNSYYAAYPAIKLWHMKVRSELQNKRILKTPLGRKRMFFNRFDDNMIRAGVAFIPQSTIGDHTIYNMCRSYEHLPQGWKIKLQVHDSVLFQIPKETEPMHVYKFIKHYMETPITIKGESFTIPIDMKVGKSWGELNKVTYKKGELYVNDKPWIANMEL